MKRKQKPTTRTPRSPERREAERRRQDERRGARTGKRFLRNLCCA